MANKNYNISKPKSRNSYDNFLRTHKMYSDLDVFSKDYRFGFFDPDNTVTTTREYLFFTKPDLNIIARNDDTGEITNKLSTGTSNTTFFKDLFKHRKYVIKMLQSSYRNGSSDPFNHLLQNMVISNLNIPSLSADKIDTATNMYGVGYSYRGSSEGSDDNPEFSLEFKDNRELDVYRFFKAYEEYETLKHHGTVSPWLGYIEDKIIHDQFAIYKFLVDEDMETILYYGKFYGVYPISLPRDSFSSSSFDSGLSYSVDFRAAFYDDMKPEIIYQFNKLTKTYCNSLPYTLKVYNTTTQLGDTTPAKCAYIKSETSSYNRSGVVYKLKWKGSDKI